MRAASPGRGRPRKGHRPTITAGDAIGRPDRSTQSAPTGSNWHDGPIAAARSDHEFAHAVMTVIESIPAGEVMTYGEVALEAGYPGTARAVGNVLAHAGRPLPWWRVVSSVGRLVPGNETDHARRLRREGVTMNADGTRVRMSRR